MSEPQSDHVLYHSTGLLSVHTLFELNNYIIKKQTEERSIYIYIYIYIYKHTHMHMHTNKLTINL